MQTGDPWCYMRQTWCNCYGRGSLPCPSVRPFYEMAYSDRTSAPLTEQRVRKIMREEIERALAARDGGEG